VVVEADINTAAAAAEEAEEEEEAGEEEKKQKDIVATGTRPRCLLAWYTENDGVSVPVLYWYP
jgi:hypothetical protein